MWRDPIDWSSFKEDLQEWSGKNCSNLRIVPTTDSKFRERLTPTHLPRSRFSCGGNNAGIYQLASVTPTRNENVQEMLMKGVPIHLANLILKIGKHHPLLGILGILPNQLRQILKETTPRFDEAFEDISSTLFWHGYQIWKLRKLMINKYWKDTAQEEWKPHPNLKPRKSSKITEQLKCRSPFHFLTRHQNLSKQLPTPCPCSREISADPVYRSQDIRSFLSLIVLPPYLTPKLAKRGSYQTREDFVRGEHDRDKKARITTSFFRT
jgi:hypothetical protein